MKNHKTSHPPQWNDTHEPFIRPKSIYLIQINEFVIGYENPRKTFAKMHLIFG